MGVFIAGPFCSKTSFLIAMQASLMLYEGSLLTTESSLLFLNSYVCHHNLTQQVKLVKTNGNF